MIRISALFRGLGWGGLLGTLFAFVAHVPSDSSRPLEVWSRMRAELLAIYEKNLAVSGSKAHAPGKAVRTDFFRPFLRPQGVVLSHRNTAGKILGYSCWHRGALRGCVLRKTKGGGVTALIRYILRSDRIMIDERLFSGTELIRERSWQRRPGRADILCRVTLISGDGAYIISRRDVRFVPVAGSTLDRERQKKASDLKIRPDLLLPFRMGNAVVYLLRVPGRGQRFLQIHPDEPTAVRILRRHLREHGGEGFFFLGKAELPVARRDRYFPFEIGNRIFYFDPNRIFSSEGFRSEFLRVRIFYPYAGYNTPYWFYRYRSRFRHRLFYLARTMLALFLTRPEPAVVIHDNRFRMGWSESILKGHDSEIAAASWREPGQRLSDFLLVTERADFDDFRRSGFNVILQEKTKKRGDGSASFVFHDLGKRYICVEVGRSGGLDTGLKMLGRFRGLSAQARGAR